MASVRYRQYTGESDLPHIMALVQSELSEPYVIYTFRYFLHQWPHLSFLASFWLPYQVAQFSLPFHFVMAVQAYPSESGTSEPIGVIVCKQSIHNNLANRGYIAMLSVDKQWRKRGIASALVRKSIEAMKEDGVDEVVLETEYDNFAALSLYESLGFIREKRLYRFYLNGKDAFRLVLSVPPPDTDNHDDSGTSSGGNTPVLSKRRRRSLGHRAIVVSPYSDDEDEVSPR